VDAVRDLDVKFSKVDRAPEGSLSAKDHNAHTDGHDDNKHQDSDGISPSAEAAWH